MSLLERHRLRRIIVALGEIEDLALRRSIPLTLFLLRLVVQEAAPALPQGEAPVTREQAENCRDVAFYGLARECMLRKDDMIKGKLTVAKYSSVAEGTNKGELLVAPGKAHRADVLAQVSGRPDAQLKGDWSDWLLPGVAMERWLSCYRELCGGDPPSDAPLFPVIGADCRPRQSHLNPVTLLERFKRWLSQLGFPQDFIDRLTVHGFRSGGCSDAINSGRMSQEKIQKQGRWSGHTYEMYVHLAGSVVRESLLETIDTAILTPAERRALTAATSARVRAFIENFDPSSH